ncbi:MAG: thioredoxin-like domain-containing protein, partial [Bacteroidota bacterium]
LLASILNTMSELEVPDYPRDEEGNITDSLFKYNYLREHYFDRVDLGDERLLRTPVYEMKINQYFDRELIQIPDSIIPEINSLLDRIIVQEKQGYEGKMYYYTLHHLFMKYQNPKYMGFDNIFVYLMEQYYLKNKVPERIVNDTAYMTQIEDRYKKMSKNRIGVTAPDLLLYSNKDTWVKLNSIKADVLVLYFFDLDCGHCKKILPEWLKLYEKNNLEDKNVTTVFIYTQTDMDKWKEYIIERGLDKGINLFDPYQNTNFRTLYDIYSTPVAYVLDKDKKIVAKRLPPETILDVVNHELGISKE